MSQLEIIYQQFLSPSEICTDTRKISKDCLFFALKGDHFNANSFAKSAIEQGAAYAIIDDIAYQDGPQYILVDDVLETLQDLAKHHRNQLQIPIIGLTGSNGKTTTKELIKAVLATKYKTFATSGNLNNHIGVPLSILSIDKDAEIAVIEMGANHQKEIEFLCEISRPTHGLITNIGLAHLDGFGGFEGVKKGKSELFTYLKAHQGIAFINQDSPEIVEMASQRAIENCINYGSGEENLISGKLIASDPTLALEWTFASRSFQVETQLTGAYNYENILAAITIGIAFKLEPEEINRGLSAYTPVNNRSQLLKTETNMLICDFYNANPSSMEVAVENLCRMEGSNKVAILGDMFELGEASSEQHQKIAAQATSAPFSLVILIGETFFNTYAGNQESVHQETKLMKFKTREEAENWLQRNPVTDSLVLLKGSRGMALEKLLPRL